MIRILGFLGVVLMLLTEALAVVRRDEPEQWIAFISDRDGNAEIYRMRPDGSDVQQLTHKLVNAAYCWIHWSPRGDWLYYGQGTPTSSLGCNEYTFTATIRPRGGSTRRITSINSSQISADGRWLADWTWDSVIQKSMIRLISPRDGHTQIVGEGTVPVFSPDGKRIAFVDDETNLHIMNVDGGEREQLMPSGLYMYNALYAWTPNGEWIVFPADEIEGSLNHQLFRVDIFSHELVLMSSDTGPIENGANLQWSPNGNWLAYYSAGKLYVLPLNQDHPTELSNYDSPQFTGIAFSWSPDSQWIVFSKYDEAGRSKIWRIHPDGTGLEQLTFGAGEDLRPAWSPVMDKAWDGWGLFDIGAVMVGVGYGRRVLKGVNHKI